MKPGNNCCFNSCFSRCFPINKYIYIYIVYDSSVHHCLSYHCGNLLFFSIQVVFNCFLCSRRDWNRPAAEPLEHLPSLENLNRTVAPPESRRRVNAERQKKLKSTHKSPQIIKTKTKRKSSTTNSWNMAQILNSYRNNKHSMYKTVHSRQKRNRKCGPRAPTPQTSWNPGAQDSPGMSGVLCIFSKKHWETKEPWLLQKRNSKRNPALKWQGLERCEREGGRVASWDPVISLWNQQLHKRCSLSRNRDIALKRSSREQKLHRVCMLCANRFDCWKNNVCVENKFCTVSRNLAFLYSEQNMFGRENIWFCANGNGTRRLALIQSIKMYSIKTAGIQWPCSGKGCCMTFNKRLWRFLWCGISSSHQTMVFVFGGVQWLPKKRNDASLFKN